MAGLFGSWLIMERVLGLKLGNTSSSSGTPNSWLCDFGKIT